MGMGVSCHGHHDTDTNCMRMALTLSFTRLTNCGNEACKTCQRNGKQFLGQSIEQHVEAEHSTASLEDMKREQILETLTCSCKRRGAFASTLHGQVIIGTAPSIN